MKHILELITKYIEKLIKILLSVPCAATSLPGALILISIFWLEFAYIFDNTEVQILTIPSMIVFYISIITYNKSSFVHFKNHTLSLQIRSCFKSKEVPTVNMYYFRRETESQIMISMHGDFKEIIGKR